MSQQHSHCKTLLFLLHLSLPYLCNYLNSNDGISPSSNILPVSCFLYLYSQIYYSSSSYRALRFTVTINIRQKHEEKKTDTLHILERSMHYLVTTQHRDILHKHANCYRNWKFKKLKQNLSIRAN